MHNIDGTNLVYDFIVPVNISDVWFHYSILRFNRNKNIFIELGMICARVSQETLPRHHKEIKFIS